MSGRVWSFLCRCGYTIGVVEETSENGVPVLQALHRGQVVGQIPIIVTMDALDLASILMELVNNKLKDEKKRKSTRTKCGWG